MCIEGLHCLSNKDAILKTASEILSEDHGSSFVIADSFEKSEIAEIENKFTKEHGFIISKKEVITFNVKHAM